MKTLNVIGCAILGVALQGCGGVHDYPPPPATQAGGAAASGGASTQSAGAASSDASTASPGVADHEGPGGSITPAESVASGGAVSDLVTPLFTRKPAPGYLWGWMRGLGVSEATVSHIQRLVADGPGVSPYVAFTVSAVGGAILGVVFKTLHSRLDEPVASEKKSSAWNSLDKKIKGTWRGITKGALAGLACDVILTGVGPYRGILGYGFDAASTATALGAIAAVAAHPAAEAWTRYGQRVSAHAEASEKAKVAAKTRRRKKAKADVTPEAFTVAEAGSEAAPPASAEEPQKSESAKPQESVWKRMKRWSSTTQPGLLLTYRIAPAVSLVVVGGGVGILVYKGLQNHSSTSVAAGSGKQ